MYTHIHAHSTHKTHTFVFDKLFDFFVNDDNNNNFTFLLQFNDILETPTIIFLMLIAILTKMLDKVKN